MFSNVGIFLDNVTIRIDRVHRDLLRKKSANDPKRSLFAQVTGVNPNERVSNDSMMTAKPGVRHRGTSLFFKHERDGNFSTARTVELHQNNPLPFSQQRLLIFTATAKMFQSGRRGCDPGRA